jgi:hypothetical protein
LGHAIFGKKMKTRILLPLAVILFIIGSCYAKPLAALIPQSDAKAAKETPVRQAAIIQATQTPAPTATATIGYQATAYIAQTEARSAALTSEAANIAVAQITADANRIELDRQSLALQQAQITQGAEVLRVQSTQAASLVTQTAAPMVATQQARTIMLDLARKTEKAAEPTQLWALANAQNADAVIKSNIRLKYAVIFFVIVSSLFVAVRLIAMAIGATKPAPVVETFSEFKPIPMVAEKENPNTTNRAEINCSDEQIVELAEGIEHQNKTLAFRQWSGTAVYKNLKQIRDFMVRKEIGFAIPLEGKLGELHITELGHGFLNMCIILKTPPAPYKCVG